MYQLLVEGLPVMTGTYEECEQEAMDRGYLCWSNLCGWVFVADAAIARKY